MRKNINTRVCAVKILETVLFTKKTLNEAFILHLNDHSESALIKELCFGVCRWYNQLQWFTEKLLIKALKAKDRDLFLLILIGFYQLHYMRIPDHAAVDATVAVVVDLKKAWAKGLINAVLRNFIRQQVDLFAAITTPEILYAHPAWLIDCIQHDWFSDWEQILQADNRQAPLSLRVNLTKITRADYLKKLAEQNIAAFAHPFVKTCVILEKASAVTEIPGFLKGEVSVQDASAQLAKDLLDLAPNLNVLDACAAPGGKTGHLLENKFPLTVTALDKDELRVKRINENLDRLRLPAHVITADATLTQTWWNNQLFDRILLDAPCSGTGVIRRHPDIKWLRQHADLQNLVRQQWQLLTTLWPLLKSKGILLYATCSILKDENSNLIKKFIAQTPDAQELKIESIWGHQLNIGKQILPSFENDGFYYARLQKL